MMKQKKLALSAQCYLLITETFRLLPLIVLLGLAFSLLFPEHALASSTGSLEWETPLKTISKSISGPVAFAISLLGIVAGGASLIFGGEINEFIRRIIMLVLVISLIVMASSILSNLFGISGAVIG